jgi:hypothetical protein
MQDSSQTRLPDPDCGCAGQDAVFVTRRRFVGAAAGTLAVVPLHTVAQSTPETEQPVATPSGEVAINLAQLASVSVALVGGGSLADAGLQTLGELISADPGRIAAFEELAALDDPSAKGALNGVSSEASDLVPQILSFWYLGEFDGKPVESRADLYYGLPVWGSLPYITQPTLCKAFGYWATEVSLD